MTAVTTFIGEGVPGAPTPLRVAPRAAITRDRRPTPRVARRRRLAVVVLALGIVVVAAQAGDALGGDSLAAPERRPAATRTWLEVTVRPGDSPWSIVARAFPGDDPRPRVDQLVAARRGAPLIPGEVIQVPR